MLACSAYEVFVMLRNDAKSADYKLGYFTGLLFVLMLEMALFGGKSLAYYIRIRRKYQDIGK